MSTFHHNFFFNITLYSAWQHLQLNLNLISSDCRWLQCVNKKYDILCACLLKSLLVANMNCQNQFTRGLSQYHWMLSSQCYCTLLSCSHTGSTIFYRAVEITSFHNQTVTPIWVSIRVNKILDFRDDQFELPSNTFSAVWVSQVRVWERDVCCSVIDVFVILQ